MSHGGQVWKCNINIFCLIRLTISKVNTRKCKIFWESSRKQPRLSCAWKCCTFRNSHLNNYSTLKKITNKFWPHSGRFPYFGQIQLYFQKQAFADNLQNRCLKNFVISTGKHLYWSLLSITLRAFSPATLLKRLQHRCFPVNIAKFLGAASVIEHLCFCTLNNYNVKF